MLCLGKSTMKSMWKKRFKLQGLNTTTSRDIYKASARIFEYKAHRAWYRESIQYRQLFSTNTPTPAFQIRFIKSTCHNSYPSKWKCFWSYFHIYGERYLNFQKNTCHPSKNTRVEKPLVLGKPTSNIFPSFWSLLIASLGRIINIQG